MKKFSTSVAILAVSTGVYFYFIKPKTETISKQLDLVCVRPFVNGQFAPNSHLENWASLVPPGQNDSLQFKLDSLGQDPRFKNDSFAVAYITVFNSSGQMFFNGPAYTYEKPTDYFTNYVLPVDNPISITAKYSNSKVVNDQFKLAVVGLHTEDPVLIGYANQLGMLINDNIRLLVSYDVRKE